MLDRDEALGLVRQDLGAAAADEAHVDVNEEKVVEHAETLGVIAEIPIAVERHQRPRFVPDGERDHVVVEGARIGEHRDLHRRVRKEVFARGLEQARQELDVAAGRDRGEADRQIAHAARAHSYPHASMWGRQNSGAMCAKPWQPNGSAPPLRSNASSGSVSKANASASRYGAVA